MNRRRCKRITARLAFDVYFGPRRLGHFWARNVSQEGLFLETGATDCTGGILDLRFQTDGVEHHLRGVIVRRQPGQGVGVQLAYWRSCSQMAHSAYVQITGCSPRGLDRAAA